MHFLTNHPELIDDITETLKLRQHDSEESVRYEVVIAIVSTAKKDFDVVSQSEDLLNFVKVCSRIQFAIKISVMLIVFTERVCGQTEPQSSSQFQNGTVPVV
jgi:hypothetical protein